MILTILFLLVLGITLYVVARKVYLACIAPWTKAMHRGYSKSVAKQGISGAVGTDWLREFLGLFVLKWQGTTSSTI